MTPATLAKIHARCFSTPKPYSEAQFTSLLAGRGMYLFVQPNAFLVAQIFGEEAEIITLATDPDHQRKGQAHALMQAFLDQARSQGATQAFLEVAEDNLPAQNLYNAYDFLETHVRKNYYRTPNGHRINAVVMMRDL